MLLSFFIDQSYRLLYTDRQLEDHHTLGDHGIRNRDAIFIIIRLPGGGGMYVTTVYQSQLYIIKVLNRICLLDNNSKSGHVIMFCYIC